VRRDWSRVSFAAEPYLAAMEALETVDEDYGADSGRSVVLYFLSNASSWRGPVARSCKRELKAMVDASSGVGGWTGYV
jgi:hypothetical protein